MSSPIIHHDAASAEDGVPPGRWSRAAVREVWLIAWPTVLTMTSYTVMQFVDKLMVAQVGPLEVAAQGNGGVWAFNLIAVVMGLLTVVNTYVSQNLGAGRPDRGPRYAWAGIWLSTICWALVMLPAALAMPWLFSLMDHEPRLQTLETQYGQIMLVGAVALLANKSMSHYFFGMHRPGVIAAAAIIGNVVNGVLNYALIYGSEGLPAFGLPGIPGAPKMGVAGAAIATVIGTLVEFMIPFAVFMSKSFNERYGTRKSWRFDRRPIIDILRLGWPASLQWGSELVCWSIFMSVLVGRFGADHMTAGWATLSYMHLSFMPAVGFSVAVSALVGRYIGAGKPDLAEARARLGLLMGMVYMSACAVAMVLFREPLIAAFVGGPDMTPERAQRIIAIGKNLMICAAIFQTVDAVGVVTTGALRGAGDTVWPGVATIVLSWTFIVGGGLLLIWLAPGLESLGPWIGASVYIVLYGIVMFLRWERGAWRSIKLIDHARHDAAMAVPLPGAPPTSGGDAVEDVAADVAEAVAESRGESRSRTRSGDRG